MVSHFQLGDIRIDVSLKDIKNIHLSVHPPTGRVRISAPSHMAKDNIRLFAISKLSWIRQQQRKIRAQERETPREYLDRESHYVWGKRYLLQIVNSDRAPAVELKHSRIYLRIHHGASKSKKQTILESWYREQLKRTVREFIVKWEPRLGVKVSRYFVQKMKTRWGSCNPRGRSIRLNTDLAKKPPECLEYIVVHEMLHILEPTHNARFMMLMDKYESKWKFYRDQLNHLPVSHEEWIY